MHASYRFWGSGLPRSSLRLPLRSTGHGQARQNLAIPAVSMAPVRCDSLAIPVETFYSGATDERHSCDVCRGARLDHDIHELLAELHPRIKIAEYLASFLRVKDSRRQIVMKLE